MLKKHYLKKWLNMLLPFACILCGGKGENISLCKACYYDLPVLKNACPVCAKPLTIGKTCGNCLNGQPFDRTFALYFYEQPIIHLIMNLKFGQALEHAELLGQLLAENIRDHWYFQKRLPDCLIPIPLHPKRLQERGFNQALELARPLARTLNIHLDYYSCKRIKYTAAQATLDAEERHENIKNAFHVAQNFSYRHVAVLDDVITTGFTMAEFCATLKKSGVETIDVWCIARPDFSPINR